MKRIIGFSTILFILIIITFLYSEPSFNGNDPGCAGGGCHSFDAGIVTAIPSGDLQIEVTLDNVSQGDKVGGELVDSEGNIIDVIQSTTNNPFTLTASTAGTYLVNAGYKEPSRDWDSVSVTLTVSDIEDLRTIHVPTKIELLGNHPNPFNNVTMIKFSLPQQSQIKLMVFNIKGQLVRILANNTFSSGIHQIMWDGKDDGGRIVASGTYLYQLISENQKISRKLVLSK
jgi:flagellar hook assembly protein FlgD